jgi:DNA invertase Pin-like site-specific DNA recombinase
MGKTLFNILTIFAELTSDLIRSRTREEMVVAHTKRKKTSQDAANRNIAVLLKLRLMRKSEVGCRSTQYEVVLNMFQNQSCLRVHFCLS